MSVIKQGVFQPPAVDIDDLPVKPIGWRILLRPFRPERMTKGGIALPDEALDNEEILTNVGQVVAIGNKAFTAITRAGINMAEVEPQPRLGDWVMFHGGHKIRTKGGVTYVLVNDDCITAVVRDPKDFKYYI